jgi:hypothetical protein
MSTLRKQSYKAPSSIGNEQKLPEKIQKFGPKTEDPKKSVGNLRGQSLNPKEEMKSPYSSSYKNKN